MDERLYETGVKWTDCAPFRATTIKDAISDLPAIETNGSNSSSAVAELYLGKDVEEQTSYQRQLRKRRRPVGDNDLCSGRGLDHVVKPERPLIQARIEQVPMDVPGADWRLIPNKKVKLSDGSTTNVLDYRFETKDGNKAVCLCQDASKTRKRRRSGRGKDNKNKRCNYDSKYKGPGQEFTLVI